jgi:hypothetical protein
VESEKHNFAFCDQEEAKLRIEKKEEENKRKRKEDPEEKKL